MSPGKVGIPLDKRSVVDEKGLSDDTYFISLVPLAIEMEAHTASRTGCIRSSDIRSGYSKW